MKYFIAAMAMLTVSASAHADFVKVPTYELITECKTVSSANSGDVLGGMLLGGLIGNNIGDGKGNGAAGAIIGGIIASDAGSKRVCKDVYTMTGYRFIWQD